MHSWNVSRFYMNYLKHQMLFIQLQLVIKAVSQFSMMPVNQSHRSVSVNSLKLWGCRQQAALPCHWMQKGRTSHMHISGGEVGSIQSRLLLPLLLQGENGFRAFLILKVLLFPINTNLTKWRLYLVTVNLKQWLPGKLTCFWQILNYIWMRTWRDHKGKKT